jgi:hypothetical protein
MPTIRGHFDGKVIVPDQPIDLLPGQEVIAHVEPVTESGEEPQSALDWLLDHAIDDPSLPSDLSVNLDHYLYGTPKQKP